MKEDARDIIKCEIRNERGEHMRIGEVSLNTNDVITLANFYKKLSGIDNGSNDEIHQSLICEETQLTIYNDGTNKNNNNQNISLAFTVEGIEAEYKKLLAMGLRLLKNLHSVRGELLI